jgi:hypothetical protein
VILESITVLMLGQAPPTSAAPSPTRTAQEVVADFVAASGGRRAFAGRSIYVRKRLISRTLVFDDQPNHGVIEMWISPAGSRVSHWSALFRDHRICDRRSCQSRDLTNNSPNQSEPSKPAAEELLDLPASKSVRTRTVPPPPAPETLDPEAAGPFECVEFTMMDESGKPATPPWIDCFDRRTHLRSFRRGDSNGATSWTTYLHYRWVHGIRVAHLERSGKGANVDTAEILTIDVKHKISPQLFRLVPVPSQQ